MKITTYRQIKTRSTPSLRPVSLRRRCRKGQGIRRKQKGDVDWGEILACHAGYYKFSHKHIKPAHTGNLLIDTHNMTHLSGFPNFSKFRQNAIMLPQTNASHGNDFRCLVLLGKRLGYARGEEQMGSPSLKSPFLSSTPKLKSYRFRPITTPNSFFTQYQ